MKESPDTDCLFISYFFPPLTGGGIPRSLNLTRFSEEIDWHANVITIKNPLNQTLDYSLINSIPKEVSVTRTSSLEPFLLYKIFGKLGFGFINNWFDWLIPVDNRIGWLPFLLPAARKIVHQKNIYLILSTSSPYCAHIAAMKLKEETGLPWLADFRDPWSFHNLPYYSGKLGQIRRKRDESLERKVYEQCDEVIVNTEYYKELLINYFNVPSRKIHLIPNGHSELDFDNYPSLQETSNMFTLMYAGSAYDEYNPSTILDGFSKFLHKNGPSTKARVWLIGQVVNWFQDHKAMFDIPPEMIICEKYLFHSSVIYERYPKATMFFFGYGKEMRWTIPGKLYEYLRTGKPILASVPDGSDVIEILNNYGGGCTILPDHDEQAAKILLSWYQSWEHDPVKFVYGNILTAYKYERRISSRKFIEIFDKYYIGA
jgi:glycosyltransferase involved in cell wall biosynthesis